MSSIVLPIPTSAPATPPSPVELVCAWIANTRRPDLILAIAETWAECHVELAGHRCPSSPYDLGYADAPLYDQAWARFDHRMVELGLRSGRVEATRVGAEGAKRRLFGEGGIRGSLPPQRVRAVIAMCGIWTGLVSLAGRLEGDDELARLELLAPVLAVVGAEVPRTLDGRRP